MRKRLSAEDAAELERRISLNRDYFIHKWGGPPWKERLHPAAACVADLEVASKTNDP
ncbi:MAG TPA: hypothetical protein PK867_13405 [Pirellulales bacterium]|nr:hypothetical protein [Pirellulales bacterium]